MKSLITKERKEMAAMVGWKTYAVGVMSILLGVYAISQDAIAEGIKGFMFGAALISVRDALGKVVQEVCANRKAVGDLRAAIEADMDRRKAGV